MNKNLNSMMLCIKYGIYSDIKPQMQNQLGMLINFYMRKDSMYHTRAVMFKIEECTTEGIEAKHVEVIKEFVNALDLIKTEKSKKESVKEKEPKEEQKPEPDMKKKDPKPSGDQPAIDEKEPLLKEPKKKPAKRGAKKKEPVTTQFYDCEENKKDHNKILQSLAKKLDPEFAKKDETRELFKKIRDELIGTDFLLDGQLLQSFINKFNESWRVCANPLDEIEE